MKSTEITADWLQAKLIDELKKFYKKEQQLLLDGLCERAVTFRFGAQILKKFKPADVYAEYNKKHDANGLSLAKSLGNSQGSSYPDLLVFSNQTRDRLPNKLVIEVKMVYQTISSDDIEHDICKLAYFTDQNNEYKYLLGAHLFLNTDNFLVVYFCDGKAYHVCRYTQNRALWQEETLDISSNFQYSTFTNLEDLFS